MNMKFMQPWSESCDKHIIFLASFFYNHKIFSFVFTNLEQRGVALFAARFSATRPAQTPRNMLHTHTHLEKGLAKLNKYTQAIKIRQLWHGNSGLIEPNLDTWCGVSSNMRPVRVTCLRTFKEEQHAKQNIRFSSVNNEIAAGKIIKWFNP